MPRCSNCNGHGKLRKDKQVWIDLSCSNCSGNGWRYVSSRFGQSFKTDCEICFGSGKHRELKFQIEEFSCPLCSGTGVQTSSGACAIF